MGSVRQKTDIIRARDGARLACARSGTGPPLVRAATWLTHVEYDWNSPVWGHWLRFLSRRHTLIRYDERGSGLSDRDPDGVRFDDWVTDLEAVVDAYELERFPLFAMSQGVAVAIEYAARHPERVERLVLYGGYAAGWHYAAEGFRRRWAALVELIRQGWNEENPAFREVFGRLFCPDGSQERRDWFTEQARRTSEPDVTAETVGVFGSLHVGRHLPELRCPTLVIHADGDAVVPLKAGRTLAGAIPGAEFLVLRSRNHILQEDEPAWERFKTAFDAFLPGGPFANGAAQPGLELLTQREQQVFSLLAKGLSNGQIAESLYITEKTVRNHVSSIFDKLDVHTRARAIVLAREAGLIYP